MLTDSSSQAAKIKNNSSSSQLFSNPLTVVAMTFGIFAISQVLAWLILDIGLSIIGSQAGMDQSAAAGFFYVLCVELISISAIFLILKRAKLTLDKIGWGRRPHLKDLNYAIIGIILFYVCLVVVSVILSALIPNYDINQTQDVGFHKLSSTSDIILAFVSLVVLAPIGEETMMRGYLYSALRSKWRFLPSMLLTSLIFGLAHLATGANGVLWAAGVTTFLLSVFLVYVRQKTGALYSSVLIHMVNNFLAFFVYIYHS